ncbi:MAG: hypothetical protein LBE60_09900 [Microbacterium sp.]|jgi:hypothetical protein|uniref:hypothetical protein n=1 Tax=Microbacterium sp. TaxID=51671 RepID=UPI002818DD10|nr:hypothetical protein [Microbacterium sp.]MDR2321946.1 hypothetical protein [Microbacterium sp.]
MPLLLADRAALTAPVPLMTYAEARMRGIRAASAAQLRVRSGIYAPRAAYLALRPWERYEARVHAFALAHPDAVLCLESAAIVWGLPLFGETRDVHVFDPERGRSRRFGDVAVHTSTDERAVVRRGPLLCTSMIDTVVDLSRVLPPAEALTVVDAAISRTQGGALDLAELHDHASGQVTTRGSARQRWLWDRADGRAESPAESVSRAVIEWCGFEDPELQQEFAGEGVRDRVDFFFPSVGAIGESDGWGKYDLEDAAKAAVRLRDEKRREDRLRRRGHPFARWDLNDAWRVVPLHRALLAAGVPLVRPRHPAMLATLRHRPRAVRAEREKPLPA